MNRLTPPATPIWHPKSMFTLRNRFNSLAVAVLALAAILAQAPASGMIPPNIYKPAGFDSPPLTTSLHDWLQSCRNDPSADRMSCSVNSPEIRDCEVYIHLGR